jgi:hypothetical protein
MLLNWVTENEKFYGSCNASDFLFCYRHYTDSFCCSTIMDMVFLQLIDDGCFCAIQVAKAGKNCVFNTKK